MEILKEKSNSLYSEYKNFGIYTSDGDLSNLNFWYCSKGKGTTEFQNVKIYPPIQPFHWLQYYFIYYNLRVLNFFGIWKKFEF